MLAKDDAEHPVPVEWRPIFHEIVEAFSAREYALHGRRVAGVLPVEPATARFIAKSVSAYGDDLAPLNAATWERSVYRWMEGYWEFIVDLTTIGEPVSDLALHAKLYDGAAQRLEIWSVHVP